jgi:hypothetical protein
VGARILTDSFRVMRRLFRKTAVLTRPARARGSTELAEVQDALSHEQGRTER